MTLARFLHENEINRKRIPLFVCFFFFTEYEALVLQFNPQKLVEHVKKTVLIVIIWMRVL